MHGPVTLKTLYRLEMNSRVIWNFSRIRIYGIQSSDYTSIRSFGQIDKGLDLTGACPYLKTTQIRIFENVAFFVLFDQSCRRIVPTFVNYDRAIDDVFHYSIRLFTCRDSFRYSVHTTVLTGGVTRRKKNTMLSRRTSGTDVCT